MGRKPMMVHVAYAPTRQKVTPLLDRAKNQLNRPEQLRVRPSAT